MQLAKVLGSVVASAKHQSYIGIKVLIVQPIDEHGNLTGTSYLAMDAVQAGEGEIVLIEREGNAARQLLGDDTAPYHSVIAAIVDRIDLG